MPLNSAIQEEEKRRAAQSTPVTPVQQMMSTPAPSVQTVSMPTWYDAQQKIYDTYQTDPTKAGQMLMATMQMAGMPESPLYRPYMQATNTMAINALTELGVDMSGGVNDDWFERNKDLLGGATYGVNNTITKGKTPASQAAYWYNQLWNDEETTKKAEREVQALVSGVQYWATQKDRNYSADEIIAKVYNEKDFPTIAKMMKAKASGTSIPLNRAVDFDLDMLGGYIWQAWNGGGTGNITADTLSYMNGYGTVWQDNEKLRQTLESNPYATGSTLDDARMYYGVSSFGDNFLDVTPIADPTDTTEAAMRQKVYNATQLTNATLEQLDSFQKDLDAAISNKTDPSKVDLDALLKPYAKLRDVDESLATGKIIGFTKAVPYSREAALQYVNAKCEQNKTKNDMAIYGQRVSDLLQFYAPTTDNVNAVREAKNGLIADATDVMLANGTTVEKNVFLNSGVYDFDTYYVPQMQQAIRNGVMDAQAGYDYMLGAADKYAGENYLTYAATIAAYDKLSEEYHAKADPLSQARSNYQKLWDARSAASSNGDIDFIMGTNAKLTEQYAAIQAMENDPELAYLERRMQEERAAYDAAQAGVAEIQKYYVRAAKIAKIGGVDVKESDVLNGLAIASAFTQYKPVDWTADMVYDNMFANGYSKSQVTTYTNKTIDEGERYIANLNNAMAKLESAGVAIPDNIRSNMERARDEVQRSVDSARYFQLQNNADFDEVVAEQREKIQDAQSGPLYFASSLFMGIDANAGEYNSMDMAAAYIGDRDNYYSVDPNKNSDVHNWDRNGNLRHDLGYFTPAERDTYLYIRAKEGPQAAYKYYLSKSDNYGVTNVRKSQDINRAVQDITAGDWVGDTAATLVTVAASLCNSQGLMYLAGSAIGGYDVNPYSDAFAVNRFNTGVRAQNKKDIQEMFKDNPVAGTLLSLGYDAVTSTGDSMVNMAVLGPVGKLLGMMGAEVAAAGSVGSKVLGGLFKAAGGAVDVGNMAIGAGVSAGMNYAEKGAENWKVLAMAGINAFAEFFSEKVSLDKLTQSMTSGAFTAGWKSFWKAVGVQAAVEGSEEGFSALITGVGDRIVMKDDSEIEQAITQYEREGMDHRSATIAAAFDSLKSVLTEMAVGALSGGFQSSVTGAGQAAAHSVKVNNWANSLNNNFSYMPGSSMLLADPTSGSVSVYNSTYDPEPGKSTTVDNYTPEQATYDLGDVGTETDVEDEVTPVEEMPQEEGPETDVEDEVAPVEEMPQEEGPEGGNKPLMKKIVLLNDAASSGNKFAQNSALAAVMAAHGDSASIGIATAAANTLMAKYGATKVSNALVDIMTSEHEGINMDAFLEGLAAISLVDASQSYLDKIFLMGNQSTTILKGVSDFGAQWRTNPNLQFAANQIQKAVLDNKVAQKVIQMVGDGALSGLASYQSAVTQAQEALRTAEERVAKQQEKVDSTADTLATIGEQYADDPTNPGMESALSHAVAELEGESTVLAEYEEARTKAENKLQETQNIKSTMTDKAMADVRQEAAAEVAAEQAAEDQAKAQAEQQEYDDAVNQYKPEVPAGSTMQVTSPDGSQTYNVIGASHFAINPSTGNAELYFTTKEGDVIPSSMLSEDFSDSVLNGLSQEQTNALMKKAPQYPLGHSVHMVNNDTGAVEIATGFGVTPTSGIVYFTTPDGKRHNPAKYTLENSADQSMYDSVIAAASAEASPIQQAYQNKQEYDAAVAKYKPAVPSSAMETATTKNGEQKNIIGVAFAEETGLGEYELYFQVSDGSVLHQNSFDDAFVDKYYKQIESSNDFDHAVQMAPEYALESSIPVMNASGKYQIVGVTEAADGTTKLVSSEGDLFNPGEVTALDGFYQDALNNAVDSFNATQATTTSQPEAPVQTTATTSQGQTTNLLPWQDPQYHGKVKAPKKLRTNTKNFQNWFSDPTGDLTNPDGTPRVIYRGTTSKVYMEHKAGSQYGADHVLNFYSPDVSITKSYASGQTHEIKTYDIVNWETAEAAMAAEGYELRKEQNSAGEWGYRAYGVKTGTQGHHGEFYRENELSKFNKEYGKIRKSGMYKGYLSLKNPLVIDAGGAPYEAVKATVTDKNGMTYTKTQSNRMWGEWARKNGYDACIVRNVKDQLSPSENHKASTKPGTVIMTFSSANFKSYWNTGKLGVKTDDIRYKAAPGTFALTGEALSPEFNMVTAKLEAGGDVTVEEIMNTPEVRYADEHNVPGESVPWRQEGYTEDELAEIISPERVSLENDIIEELANRGCAIIDKNGNVTYDGNVRHDKRVDIIIGPPAAGKSTALANPLSYQYGARILDSDDVKARLPEYNNGLGSNHLNTESRIVWKKMQDRAIAGGDNVVLPIVGHNYDSALRDVAKFKNAGYTVNVHYLELDGKKAIGRALQRLASDGRYIKLGYLYDVSMGGKIDAVYEQLKGSGLVDGYSHWSNDVAYGESPRYIESSGPEAVGKLYGALTDHGGVGEESARVPSVRGGRLHPGVVREGVASQAEAGTHYLKPGTQNTGAISNTQNSTGKVVSPVQIANTLVDKLGVGNYIGKKGGTPAGALGYYQTHADLVGVRPSESGRYTSTMHEAFHAIAERVKMAGTPDMIGKLSPMFAQSYDVSELPGEAFAEFGWMYMTDEGLARAFAGDAFYDQFEREMRKAGIYNDVVEARDNLRAFNAAKADAQIGAVVQDASEAGKKKRSAQKLMRIFFSDAVDQSSAAEAINREIRTQQKANGVEDYNNVDLSEDVRSQALLRNHSGKRAWYLTMENLTDPNGNIIGKSLATRFQEAGITAKGSRLLTEYMLALHSLDRDAQGKAVFDNNAVTHQKRIALIQDVQANHPEIVRAEQAFQEFRNEFLQAWGVDTGMISQEQLDNWNRLYPHYVPTKRVKAGDFASGQSNQHFEVHEAKGSTEDIINPIDTFMSMVNGLVSDVMSNNVGLALERAYNSYEGMGEFARRVPSHEGSNVIDVVHSDGSRTYYQINDAELFKLIANQNERVQKDLMSKIGILTRTMTGLTTGSNPIFALTNFMRDFQNSVNYGSWASWYGSGLVKWLAAAKDVATRSGEYVDYAALGGLGWSRIDPRTTRGAAEYRSALFHGYGTDTLAGKARNIASNAWSILTLERLNEIVEQTSRYAEYKYGKHDKSTSQGKQKAFLAAQDVTVDFTRAGNAAYAKTLRQFVPFLNASAQGSYRTGRMFTEAERSRLPVRLAKTILNTGLSSALASLLLLKFMDDKDKEDFANMSDDMKAQNFYVPNPSTAVFGEQPIVRIPIEQDPLAYFVHGMVTNAIWSGKTDDPIVIDLVATAETMIKNMIPIDNGTIFDPFLATIKNESWYGSKIVPTRMDGWEPSTQYTEETPEMFVTAGRMLNTSPMKLQYLAQQYSGFVGQIGIPAASAWQTDGPVAALQAVAGVVQKRLTSDPLKSSEVINAVYAGDSLLQTVVKAGKNEKPMNMLRRGLTPEQAGEAYDEAKAMTSTTGIVGQTKKFISEGYNEIDKINSREDLTDHEKYLLTRDIRRGMAEQALIANEAIGAFKEQYFTGDNILVKTLTNLTPGTTARIKTDAERMDPVFLNDSEAEYMQRTMEVYETTGNASHLPEPKQTFDKTTNGVKNRYTVPDAMWDGYVEAYQEAYETELMRYDWYSMTDAEKAAAVKNARTKGNDAAKKYYFNNEN